jgi:hypothetical protein
MYKKLIFLTVLTFSTTLTPVLATWVGPQIIVEGGWGVLESQFGYYEEYINDRLPRNIIVGKDDVIVVADEVNRRVKVYDSKGSILKIITPKIENQDGWPSEYIALANNFFVTDLGGYYEVYSIDNDTVLNFEMPRTKLQGVFNDGSLLMKDYSRKKFVRVDINGHLLEILPAKPFEFGFLEEVYSDSSKNKYKIKYEGIDVQVESNHSFTEGIAKDKFDNIYGIGQSVDPKDLFITVEMEDNSTTEIEQPHFFVSKYSRCGKQLGVLDLPANNSGFVKSGSEIIFDETALKEYGRPFVSESGEVFAWERSVAKYIIYKWTWVDDPSDLAGGPDAPANLTVQPSIDGLYLTWGASPQDPGCVDGYEVERATSAGGIYTSVKTTDPGVLKFNDTGALPGSTYLYKVRAKSGSTYSPYTAEMSGTR